ncbi:MAG: D-2-hydroxyacid dehydrogenase [bacterium]|nr:D-2-hydroxyacid dehydrogenase [bacterium]MDZ4284409.1 D-2-hydroxyacid dehydrogenase [Patescibacteria group bacterium]
MKILIIPYATESPGVPLGPHTFREVHLRQIEEAAAGRAEVVVALPEDATVNLADVDVIAGFPSAMPDFANAPNLRWVHSFSAGVDRVLTPDIRERDILLSNSSGIHATPIAEHILGFLLLFTRGFYRTFKNQAAHVWQKDETLGELRDAHVLIVGLGAIGAETARLAAAFSAHVSAVARGAREKSAFVERIGVTADMDAMLPEADFVVITLPYTPETHHFFSAERFALMKPSSVIINIGRGGIIDQAALIDALNAKKIFGAALDVTDPEPLPSDSPLWGMENVIITPHHSGLSGEYMNRAVSLFCDNLRAFLDGSPLPTEVDKIVGY